MHTAPQAERRSSVTSRVRWMALLSLLLLWLVPQAHLVVEHSEAAPVFARQHGRSISTAHAEARPSTDAADLCMLCSVFGSVMQASLLRVAAPAVPALRTVYAAVPQVAARPPTFDLLSRPPPIAPDPFGAGVERLQHSS